MPYAKTQQREMMECLLNAIAVLALVVQVSSFSRFVLLFCQRSSLNPSKLSYFSLHAKKSSSANPYPHLHITEYPNDDFNHVLGYGNPNEPPSRLQEISARCIDDVIRNKKPIDALGCGIDASFYVSADDLREEIFEFDNKYGEPLSLFQRLRAVNNQMKIAAEFKRASPSKGDINVGLDAAEQCLKYAQMGASVLSVLTEFRYFKGSLRDMKNVRLAVQKAFSQQELRPLVLRKDFIFDRYQILEARANGADTLLLIVAVLGRNQLNDLLSFSRSLGMEPLVEVNTPLEMEIALDAGASCIGINNRNLHNFQLDLTTTERCLEVVKRRKGENWFTDGSLCVAALSGITDAQEVKAFQRLGVQCVLVGETLMKAADPAAKIRELLSTEEDVDNSAKTSPKQDTLVKLCGMTKVDQVQGALSAGTNLIGFIMVPQSPRFVQSTARAKEIVDVVRRYGERTHQLLPSLSSLQALAGETDDKSSVSAHYQTCMDWLQRTTRRQPLSVAVVRDQTVQEVQKIVDETGCDLVQLHGDEQPDNLSGLTAPVIKVLHIDIDNTDKASLHDYIMTTAKSWQGKAVAILLDAKSPSQSSSGGLGKPFQWHLLEGFNEIPVLLAGGINAENVGQAAALTCVGGVDINSGVETAPGDKDLRKVRAIIPEVRKAPRGKVENARHEVNV